MKKFIFLISLLLLPLAALFAQETAPDIGDVLQTGSLTDFFLSLAALVPLVTAIAAFINSKFTLSGTTKQIIAWLVSIVLCVLAWWLKIGMFDGITWWLALVYGFAIGLASNGFFDIKMIQSILAVFKLGKKTA